MLLKKHAVSVKGYDEIRPYDRIQLEDGKMLRTIKDIDARIKDEGQKKIQFKRIVHK